MLKAVVALVIILADRMWKKLPSDHPAVYREPAMDDSRNGRYREPFGSNRKKLPQQGDLYENTRGKPENRC